MAFIKHTDEVTDKGAAEGDEKKKKRQTRGGKGMIKTKKETAEKERKVVMSRAPRGKKKYVTVVTGLGTFGKYDSRWWIQDLPDGWVVGLTATYHLDQPPPPPENCIKMKGNRLEQLYVYFTDQLQMFLWYQNCKNVCTRN